MSASSKDFSTEGLVYQTRDGATFPISDMCSAESATSNAAENEVMNDVMFTMRSVPTENTILAKCA